MKKNSKISGKKENRASNDKNNNLFLKNKLVVIIFVIILFVLVLFIGIYLLVKFQNNNNLNSASSEKDYQITMTASQDNNVFLTGVYQYQEDKTLTHFRLVGPETTLEDQFYDVTNKTLYYQNINTHLYTKMDYETDFTIDQFFQLLDSKNVQNVFGTLRYKVNFEDFLNIFNRPENLFTTYLNQLGYMPLKQDLIFKVSYNKDLFNQISVDLNTSKGVIKMLFNFQLNDKQISLPLLDSSYKNEKKSAEWIMLYIRKIYSEETQIEKGITDISYFMNSKYRDEIEEKLLVKPKEVRFRVMPSTVKDSGILNGTITFENDVTVTIENSIIKSIN